MNKIEKGGIAVIYCRVSTKEQVEEGNSLVTQERLCREYANKEGYEISDIFIEQGESAKTANRTKLQELLVYCSDRKNKISIVIVYKLDRLSRNTDDYSQIRLLLKRYGVEIKSTTEYFENTPAGRFMENIISNVAQFDNDVRTERSIGGMKEAVREGRYVWHAPIGYKNLKVHGKSTIVQDEMAYFVQLAFEQVAENICPIYHTLKKINEAGLRTKVGKKVSKSQFYYLLNNELYAGWITQFGERNKGLFDPIVAEDLFSKVQFVLKKRSRQNTHYITENPDFPLRRFVKHTSGKSLTGSWSKGREKYFAYYRFNIKNGNYTRSYLENLFKDFQDEFSVDSEKCKMIGNFVYKKVIKATIQQGNEETRLKNFIVSLKDKQNLLIQKNLNGVISDTILKDQLTTIQDETYQAERSLDKIPSDSSNRIGAFKVVEDYLQMCGDIWAKASPERKRRLQWFHFPEGVTFDGNKFGTTKTSFIFKAKGIILDNKSNTVPLDLEFWNQFIYDCERLTNILKE